MTAWLQTELQLTKTLPQATTELVNSRMVGKPESAGLNRHVVGDERALQERK
jgi:hypothetical protein